MRTKKLPLALIGLLFVYFCYINYLTPSHSDDFRYAPFGLGLQSHIHQYLEWSGRIVADYVSPALLAIPYKPVLALLQTLAMFALVYLVFKIPQNSPYLKAQKDTPLPWVFLILLSLYTLSVPSFGQTNLWVVGSANYLWTTLVYTGYIYLFIGFTKRPQLPVYAYPLALVAGCTNEAAAAIISLFSVIALIAYTLKNKKISLQLTAYVLLFLIGAVVLIAAPGNGARLDGTEFGQWNHYSVFEKIIDHFFGKKFINAVASSLMVYLPLMAYFVFLIKNNKPHRFNLLKTSNSDKYSLIFFFMALSTSAIMAFSPVYPPRAMVTAFIFCLTSVSFILHANFLRPSLLRKMGLGLTTLTLVCLISITPRYQSLHQQEAFINRLVANNTDREATLPSFFQRWTPFKDFKIDGYMNKADMAKYYQKDKISVVDPHFDFAVLLAPPTQILQHQGNDIALYHYPYADRFQFYKKIVLDRKNLPPGEKIKLRVTYGDQSSERITDFKEIALGDGFLVADLKSSPFKSIARVEITSD